MNILYATQATGNGHLSRAKDIVPSLGKHGEVDLLISGCPTDGTLGVDPKFVKQGIGLQLEQLSSSKVKDGNHKIKASSLWKETMSLPIKNYDLVVSDFEPISAWSAFFYDVPCVGLSHQAGVVQSSAPQPPGYSNLGQSTLDAYTPSQSHYGFHFERYGASIYTPVIRKELREINTANHGHYTVYVPALSDSELIKVLSLFPDIQWEVFSKHTDRFSNYGHIRVRPVNCELFARSMASSAGVLCGAGFETPAEAMFLAKKLMVIEDTSDYEHQCNAAALAQLGVTVVNELSQKNAAVLEHWLNGSKVVEMNYPNQTDEIVENILDSHLCKQMSLGM